MCQPALLFTVQFLQFFLGWPFAHPVLTISWPSLVLNPFQWNSAMQLLNTLVYLKSFLVNLCSQTSSLNSRSAIYLPAIVSSDLHRVLHLWGVIRVTCIVVRFAPQSKIMLRVKCTVGKIVGTLTVNITLSLNNCKLLKSKKIIHDLAADLGQLFYFQQTTILANDHSRYFECIKHAKFMIAKCIFV